jgi:hypothetical protein
VTPPNSSFHAPAGAAPAPDARELRYTVSFDIALAQFAQECRAAGGRRRAEAGD